MVKTPRTRHSRPNTEPVTIDLEPGEVSRVSDTPTTDGTAMPERDAHAGNADPEAVEAVPEAEPFAETDAKPAAGEPQAVAAAAPVDLHGPQHIDAGTSPRDTVTPAATVAPTPSGYDFDADDKPKSGGGAGEPPKDKPREMPKDPFVTAPATAKRSGTSPLVAGVVGGVVALLGAGILQYAGVLGAPGGQMGAGAIQADIATLQAEVAALKGAPAAPDLSGTVNGLAGSLDQVKADVAALRQAVQAGGSGDTAGLADLDARMKALESSIASLGQAGGAVMANDVSAINEKLAAVEALANSAGSANAELATRLGALEQSVSGLSAKVEAQIGQPKVALAIAAAALKSAVDRGAPFQAEIETFAAVAPGLPEIEALRAHAEQGVPTRAELVAGIDETAGVIIAAANPPAADAGFFDRLLSSAESLVTVRPIGAVSGDGVPEKVARMEVALKAGDLAQAMAEYDSLPDAAKAAGAAFADKLKARLDVEKLVDQAVASAMKA
jgi:hypothetical protein